jgi:hypothetical protein
MPNPAAQTSSNRDVRIKAGRNGEIWFTLRAS